MSAETAMLRGTVQADGTLEVRGKVDLTPGPVEVMVRTVPAGQREGLLAVLARIRSEQRSDSHVPRTAAEIDGEIRQMRDEWEEHQLAIERLQEQCAHSRKATGGQESRP